MSPNGVTVIGEVISLVLVVAILVVYGPRMNWRDRIAQHIVAFVSAIGAQFALALIRVWTHSNPDTGWFAWLRAVVFWLIPAVLAWRLAIIVGLTKRSKR